MAPQSVALTTKVALGSPYQLDKSQTSKASSALLKYIHKSAHENQAQAAKRNLLSEDPSNVANAEPISLVLTTKTHIVPQRRLKPGKILLPHSINTSPSLSICLITPSPQRAFKDLIAHPSFPSDLSKRITRVIDIQKLQKKYQSFESRRQLRDSHDIYLADDRIITYLSKTLGKIFYGSPAKRPIPIHLAAYKAKAEKSNAALPSTKPKKDLSDIKSIATSQAVAQELERTLSTTQVYLSPSVTTSIRVGLSSQSPDELSENIRTVVEAMTEKYIDRKWRGIQAIHIKGPNTMALPIWLANELWGDEHLVKEDHEIEELRLRALEDKKRKKRKMLETNGQFAMESSANNTESKKRRRGDVENGQHSKEMKRETQDDGFNKEMKERREMLREQKRRIQASLENGQVG